MAKTIRLTEDDLTKLVRKVIQEQGYGWSMENERDTPDCKKYIRRQTDMEISDVEVFYSAHPSNVNKVIYLRKNGRNFCKIV
jgi:hypothetical protein